MSKEIGQKKKSRRSVSRRLTLLIIFMIVGISAVMMIIGYLRFKDATEEYYFKLGENTGGVVAQLIDPDLLPKYADTLKEDAAFKEVRKKLQEARKASGAQMLYVFTVNPDGVTYIYDTDPEGGLGAFDAWTYEGEDGKSEDLYPETTKNQILSGGKVDTIMGVTSYGWTITSNIPLYGSDGYSKGYVGIDFDVNQMMQERSDYFRNLMIIILITTVVFGAIYLFIIRKTIIHPVNTMAKAADSFVVEDLDNDCRDAIADSEILSMEINTKDEFQSLAESLKSMVWKIDEHLTNLNLATIKSETDGLTSLVNRGAFEQRVNAILNLRQDEGQLNCFMMIDVDYFKSVNDNYGHAAGDLVLSSCAKALKKIFRESDVVGRLGGDEFAVFCKSIGSVSMAETKAKLIQKEWAKIVPPGAKDGVTASIGISFAPTDGQEYQELFNASDAALYRAKDAGRDCYALSD
ncbi:MAG: sensor domain-containing diguanylate cyclase [Clostridiales Family XIII bacterium]|nr:sensor domain-containing diguanylate cyclase [Clostridiales Family XIII bacterium]